MNNVPSSRPMATSDTTNFVSFLLPAVIKDWKRISDLRIALGSEGLSRDVCRKVVDPVVSTSTLVRKNAFSFNHVCTCMSDQKQILTELFLRNNTYHLNHDYELWGFSFFWCAKNSSTRNERVFYIECARSPTFLPSFSSWKNSRKKQNNLLMYSTVPCLPSSPTARPAATGLKQKHVFILVARFLFEHLANASTVHSQLQLDLFQDLSNGPQLFGLLGHLHSHEFVSQTWLPGQAPLDDVGQEHVHDCLSHWCLSAKHLFLCDALHWLLQLVWFFNVKSLFPLVVLTTSFTFFVVCATHSHCSGVFTFVLVHWPWHRCNSTKNGMTLWTGESTATGTLHGWQ